VCWAGGGDGWLGMRVIQWDRLGIAVVSLVVDKRKSPHGATVQSSIYCQLTQRISLQDCPSDI
jgi:hypothetical protein